MADNQEQAAVIVGASGGIGAAAARLLRASGRFAIVHALSRSETGFDLEDEASIAEAAARVAEGPPPTLVFVATGVLHHGFEPERGYRALTAEHMLRDYRINTAGPALVAKHFLPLTPRDRRAVFAALSARVGSIGDNRLGGWHGYRASKAALNMLVRNLAIEERRRNDRAIVVTLHPGTVDTALSRPFQNNVPKGQLSDPERAALQLLDVIEGLKVPDSGKLFDFQGEEVPF